jgi:predicted CopG family antitoxin
MMMKGNTNIRISWETHEKLRKMGIKGETFDQIIARPIERAKKAKPTDLNTKGI